MDNKPVNKATRNTMEGVARPNNDKSVPVSGASNSGGKPASGKTKWAIFVLLIVVSLYSCVKIFQTPSTSPIHTTEKDASFEKTTGNHYSNSRYHFSITFPEGWKIEAGDSSNVVVQALDESANGILITVNEVDPDFGTENSTVKDIMSVEEFREIGMEGAAEVVSDPQLIGYGETDLKGEPAYWLKYSGTKSFFNVAVNGIYINYSLFSRNIFYSITVGSTVEEFAAIEPIVDRSVKTFTLEN